MTFIYTDGVDFSNAQLVFDLFCQSDLFSLDKLKARCEKALLGWVDIAQVCESVMLGRYRGCTFALAVAVAA